MTKVEQLIEALGGSDDALALVDQVRAEIRAEMLRDIVIDLADFAGDAPASERKGFRAAIEVLKSNY